MFSPPSTQIIKSCGVWPKSVVIYSNITDFLTNLTLFFAALWEIFLWCFLCCLSLIPNSASPQKRVCTGNMILWVIVIVAEILFQIHNLLKIFLHWSCNVYSPGWQRLGETEKRCHRKQERHSSKTTFSFSFEDLKLSFASLWCLPPSSKTKA